MTQDKFMLQLQHELVPKPHRPDSFSTGDLTAPAYPNLIAASSQWLSDSPTLFDEEGPGGSSTK